MSIDERDTRLGELLDRAVRGVEVEGAPNEVVSRGSRRRAGTVVAAVTAAALFVAGVGFAATQVGRDAKPKPATPQGWTTLSAPDIPWSMPVPTGWSVGASRFVGGVEHILDDTRSSFVTNAEDGPLRGDSSFGKAFLRRTADDTVVVRVDEFIGQGESRPTSLVFNAAREITGVYGWTSRDGKICSESACVRVYLEQGPEASAADIETATQVAEGVKPATLAPAPTSLQPMIQYDDQAHQAGFRLEYPTGWVVVDDPLTDLVEPSEIVSVATYDLVPGGRSHQGFDAVIPAALDQLGPEDVFITLQEYDGARVGGTPLRPAAFVPDTVCSDQACVDGRGLGLDGMRAWWISFEDAASDRTFSALVAMGEQAFADPDRFDAAWRVLDSLSFDRPGNPQEYDRVFDVRGRGWRFCCAMSGPAEEGVRYRFAVSHCGLEHLVDFDGSFWEPIPPLVEGIARPSSLKNGDLGTITMINPSEATYASSSGEMVALQRVGDSVVRGGCI